MERRKKYFKKIKLKLLFIIYDYIFYVVIIAIVMIFVNNALIINNW